ncbi:M3 family metallopeptidase [Thermodesulfobacteriota bacterium]
MKNSGLIVIVTAAVIMVVIAAGYRISTKRNAAIEAAAAAVIDEHVSLYRPLEVAWSEAWWEASTTGSEEAYDRMSEAEIAALKVSSDHDRFEKIESFYKDRGLKAPALKRQIEILYRDYLTNQLPEELLTEITETKNRAKKGYSTFRPVVRGDELDPTEVQRILTEETDSALLEETWKATKSRAAGIIDDHRKLAKLRNEAAAQLGFADYYAMAAFALDYDLDWLEEFFTEVAAVTEEPFHALKTGIVDPALAAKYGVPVDSLMPWHYGNEYFQATPPGIYELDLDHYYEALDAEMVLAAAVDFYRSIGFDISAIIERSSLYPRPGKTPHAHANKMDREKPGTSVLIMNLPEDPAPQTHDQTSTLVHELSHDIHYEGVDHAMPYLFLDILSQMTEAYAMLMERQVMTKDWLTHVLGMRAEDAEAASLTAFEMLKAEELIFLRWCLVIYHFERTIYKDPDQDWGDLWWTYKERFQNLRRPEGWDNPDPLAKYHLAAGRTAYYNHYAVGRFIAAQVAAEIAELIDQDPRYAVYYGREEIGHYLTETFFPPGAKHGWLDNVGIVTGDPLDTKYWKTQILD